MRSLSIRCLPFAALAAVCYGAAARAQVQQSGAAAESRRITGVVRDTRGTALPAARITVTNNATGISKRTVTTDNGSYAVTALDPGNYTITVTQLGYKRSSRSALSVPAGGAVDFEMQPATLAAVVVTATLREQDVGEVPFSIAAPTASVLRNRGVENVENLAAHIAGFSVQNLGPGQSQVAMRGVSSGQVARDQPGVKEQVGAYLDDVPMSLSLFTPDLEMFDISRIEVLRGPQGTLFGAGSLAGTVRYITNQPELGVRSTFGETGGTLNENGGAGGSLKLGANIPWGDKAAFRIAAYDNQLGGYMNAIQPTRTVKNVNSGHRAGVRAALTMAPNDRLTITPRLVFQNTRMDGWNRIDTFNILANPYTTTRPKVDLGGRNLYTQIGEPFTDNFLLSDVNVRYDFGRTSLTSVSAYGYRDVLVVRDAGALTSSITGGSIGLPASVYTLPSPLDDATKAHFIIQEMRLSGATDRFKWVTGAFYTNQQRGYDQTLLVRGFEDAARAGGANIPTKGLRAAKDELFFSDLYYRLNQYALFGEATVPVGDRLNLTAGLRYYNFDEHRAQIFDGIFANDSTGKSVVSTPGSTNANGVAPRFMASYRATDNVMFNAQASKGFRLGGINDPLNLPLCTQQDRATFSGRDSWRDEAAWNYEAGAKSTFLGGRASLNVSAFYMDITDLQLVVTAGSCSSRLVFNVPKATSSGLDFELTATPTDQFDFVISASVNNSKLGSTLTSTAAGQTTVVSGIQDGNRLPSVPHVQGAGAATYRWPVRAGSQAFVTGTYSYVGSHYTLIDDQAAGVGTVNMNSFAPNTIGGPLTQQTFTFDPLLPAYSLANLRVGLTRTRWETAFFVNNLMDTRALLALDRERGLRARVGYLTNPPRTYGVSVRFSQ